MKALSSPCYHTPHYCPCPEGSPFSRSLFTAVLPRGRAPFNPATQIGRAFSSDVPPPPGCLLQRQTTPKGRSKACPFHPLPMEIRGRRALEKVEADVDSKVLSPRARREGWCLYHGTFKIGNEDMCTRMLIACFHNICLQIDDFCFHIEWACF